MKSRSSDFRTRRLGHRAACSPPNQETRVTCKGPVKHNARNGRRSDARPSLPVLHNLDRQQFGCQTTKLGRTVLEEPIANATEHSNAIHNDAIIEKTRGPEERDSFTLYLKEIGQTKLLSPEEEILLAKRIRKGDEKARQEMIKANLRLVVTIAREYQNCGVPLLDLINEGNIGLIKAVERFDPRKGAKLSTYAAFWIKQCIRRALSH